MSTITLPIGNIMRTFPTRILKKLSAFLVLSAVAIAQSQDPVVVTVTDDNQETKVEIKSPGSESFFHKIGGYVDLNKMLEDLPKVRERLEAMEAKISKLQRTATQGRNVSESAPGPVENPVPPVPPEPARSSVTAERVNVESFGLLPTESARTREGTRTNAGMQTDEEVPMPFLNENTPEWVKSGLRNGGANAEERSFVISSSLLPDLEQCSEDLKSRMMAEVRAYLKKNVLEFESAKLPQLTQEYIEKYWVKREQFFDNVQDRPSGTYHQLWMGLHISSEQLAKIRGWEKQSERDVRIKKAGTVGGAGILAITLLSGI